MKTQKIYSKRYKKQFMKWIFMNADELELVKKSISIIRENYGENNEYNAFCQEIETALDKAEKIEDSEAYSTVIYEPENTWGLLMYELCDNYFYYRELHDTTDELLFHNYKQWMDFFKGEFEKSMRETFGLKDEDKEDLTYQGIENSVELAFAKTFATIQKKHLQKAKELFQKLNQIYKSESENNNL